MRRQEALEELEEFLAPLREELAELSATIDAANNLHLDVSGLEDRYNEIEDEISEIESRADDDYDDYDGPDDYDDPRIDDLERYGTDSQYY
jgi:predicted nuclease with TOPRIM domain